MNSKRNPLLSIINPETGLEIKKTGFMSPPYVHCLSEELRRILYYTGIQVLFKGNDTLVFIVMHPRIISITS